MQKVLTAAQMREVDGLTTERYGIPSIILMENAAHAVARVIAERLGGLVEGKRILILCGKGNNGGDGAALARILASREAHVMCVLVGRIEETSGDARKNFEILAKLQKHSRKAADLFITASKGPDKDFLGIELAGWDLFVDALVGTGTTRGIDEWLDLDFAQQFQNWNPEWPTKRPLRIAVDIPSGLSSDSGEPFDRYFEVEATVTFTSPKAGNILLPASRSNGELVVADIGSPQELIDEQTSQLYLADKSDAARWLKQTRFSDDSYKNKRGHALLLAGSENYSGAAVLAGNAAMRSGVGLVTLAAPKECKAEIASRLLPDVILTAIETDEPELLTKADAIAVGCGLDANDPAIEKLVRKVVSTREVPVIVDAGALWFFNLPDGIPAAEENQPPLIFTPHEGEFLRLLGTDDKEAIKDRVAAVRDFATKHNVILVLKGERVLIGEPGGKVVVNPTGNSGLGKAGNGDTLTGILVGFVAQATEMKIEIFETVVAAVYIAGMAGDIAEKKYGKRVMTASDVRECLVEAFSQLTVSN